MISESIKFYIFKIFHFFRTNINDLSLKFPLKIIDYNNHLLKHYHFVNIYFGH